MKTARSWSAVCLFLFLAIATFWPFDGQSVDLTNRLQAPSWTYWFGTDWLGRDMFARTLKAMVYSLALSGCAALLCSSIALIFAVLGNVNKTLCSGIDFLIDCILSLPNLLLLIILTITLGGGAKGVLIAVALSHWPKLTRLCKAEIHALMSQDYIRYATSFGYSRWYVIVRHIVPHILPQWITGTLLHLPHILLHIAGLSFLGFGLHSNHPSMGRILHEANAYLLTGDWWLVLCPGLVLVTVTLLVSHTIRTLSF